MIKVIGGRLKGRHILTYKGSTTRPTLAKTRGTIFNILNSRYYLEDFTAIDLFAGSGALGLEGYSQGVKHTYFIEKNRKAYEVLKKNIQSLTSKNETSLHCGDAIEWIVHHRFNYKQYLFLIDPPYETELAQKVINRIKHQKGISPGSVLVIEIDLEAELRYPENFKLIKQKIFNKTRLDFIEITSP